MGSNLLHAHRFPLPRQEFRSCSSTPVVSKSRILEYSSAQSTRFRYEGTPNACKLQNIRPLEQWTSEHGLTFFVDFYYGHLQKQIIQSLFQSLWRSITRPIPETTMRSCNFAFLVYVGLMGCTYRTFDFQDRRLWAWSSTSTWHAKKHVLIPP